MSEATFQGVRIRGVAAAVPELVRTLADDAMVFDATEVEKISASTGVRQRHVGMTLTTADLCQAAAERLLAESGCARESIDAVIFISQTPDYRLPATSCCLQQRLGLSQQCAAFDVSLGCSGYLYGLWLASGMISCGAIRRALVLAGDTSLRICSPEDRSVALLFADGGTATIVERHDATAPSHFVLGTDGSGEPHLNIPAGGFRMRSSPEMFIRREFEGGNRRAATDLYMNGAEIFSFTLRVVPALVKKVLERAGLAAEGVDQFVFHQANKFMLDHLIKRMKLAPEKCLLGLENYGNTSSASIPLAMVTHLGERLRREELSLVLAGFGVGFSWGGASLRCGPMTVPALVLVPEPLRP
ncbi:3-oxoacyl-ACP synthase III family protein [Candidatus Thiodictyon syntrophicum]|jgi:3-oxoacyl-[acyl-carrier-protein] synthase-3|uniref:3-oxoacyl-ACP synthase n=1 Tax=Candidatus Thiodictyon syntrophicum TaxID=1166950 RepID=A0A2K8UDD0_9GAMM|nr:ketoacyl-ACP synthase III [Candidatus Thiodictyon syntrophicum]AUB83525.1 hypothetical protein THSYN_22960 [Candidatus Thiodictyon syntrophicum]